MTPRICQALCLSTLLLPAAAWSQAKAPLDRFSASESPDDDFHVSRPTTGEHLRFGAQLHLDYALNPLVFEDKLGDAGSESTVVVAHHLVGNAGLSLGVSDRVLLYGGLPVTLVMTGDEDPREALGGARADGTGLGDASLGGRVRILGDAESLWALGAQVTVTLPTADLADDTQRFLGESTFTATPELLVAFQPGSSRLVLNLGTRLREATKEEVSNLSYGTELTWALGFATPLWTSEADDRTHLDGHVQAYGASTLDDFLGREATPLEATAGVKWFHASGVVLGAAAGPGLIRGVGSPDLRGVLLLGWQTPEAREAAPVDTDGDGLLDPDDQCPLEPEDKDGFEDANGCPDPDNDQDGILDTADKCINDPETQNGFEDADGCPDAEPDTDGDGLVDSKDRCPQDPEDKDGFEDEDGCPDPDNDKDGVVDAADRCINEPGVIENRGCPDADRDGDTVVDRLDNCPDVPGDPAFQGCKAPQKVKLVGGKLEILDKVYFKTDKDIIEKRSEKLLQNVADVIKAHPEIEKIRVEGHTDSRGKREYNVDLSKRRAKAVVEWLATKGGVARERLESEGYGPDRPLVTPAKSAKDHAQNRRVEFVITGATSSEIQGSGNKAGEDTIDR